MPRLLLGTKLGPGRFGYIRARLMRVLYTYTYVYFRVAGLTSGGQVKCLSPYTGPVGLLTKNIFEEAVSRRERQKVRFGFLRPRP